MDNPDILFYMRGHTERIGGYETKTVTLELAADLVDELEGYAQFLHTSLGRVADMILWDHVPLCPGMVREILCMRIIHEEGDNSDETLIRKMLPIIGELCNEMIDAGLPEKKLIAEIRKAIALCERDAMGFPLW